MDVGQTSAQFLPSHQAWRREEVDSGSIEQGNKDGSPLPWSRIGTSCLTDFNSRYSRNINAHYRQDVKLQRIKKGRGLNKNPNPKRWNANYMIRTVLMHKPGFYDLLIHKI